MQDTYLKDTLIDTDTGKSHECEKIQIKRHVTTTKTFKSRTVLMRLLQVDSFSTKEILIKKIYFKFLIIFTTSMIF